MDEHTRERLAYLEGQTEVIPKEHNERQEDLDAAFQEIQKEKPGLLLANEILADYKLEKSEREKKESCKRIIRHFFNNPYTLETFFDRLNFLETFDEKNKPIIEKIREDIDKFSDETTEKEQLEINPDKQDIMDRWIELYTHSTQYHDIVEKYLRLSFEAVHDDETYLRRLYPIAYTAVNTGDFEIMHQAIVMLLRDTSVLPGSVQELDRYAACILSTKDEILKYALDIDAVTDFFGKLYGGESYAHFRTKLDTMATTLGQKSRSAKFASENRKNPKFLQIMQMHDTVNGENPDPQAHAVHPDAEKLGKYPYTLFMAPEHITPLRKILNEKMAVEMAKLSGKRMVPIYKPGEGEAVFQIPDTYEDRLNYIKGLFCGEQVQEEQISEEKIFESFAFLFPDIAPERKAELIQRIFDLKTDLRTKLQYLVSPRGDKIVIEDDFLNGLGIESISYIPQSSVLDLEIHVRVGKVDCVCTLDNYYTLRNKKTNKPLKLSPEKSLLLSELILSQLRKLLCEKAEQTSTKKGTGSQIEGEKETSRRAHVRRLPEGQGYTQEQSLFALTHYGVDLGRFNADLGLDKTSGQYTLVRQVAGDAEKGSRPPVQTHIKIASKLSELLKSSLLF